MGLKISFLIGAVRITSLLGFTSFEEFLVRSFTMSGLQLSHLNKDGKNEAQNYNKASKSRSHCVKSQ